MPRIHIWLHSLTQIMIDYHGNQTLDFLVEAKETDTLLQPNLSATSNAEAVIATDMVLVNRLSMDENSMQVLDGLIGQMNEKRRPLFSYIWYIIQQLNQFIHTPIVVYDAEPLALMLQNNLAQFVLHMQLLLKTSQTSALTIEYNQQAVSIAGLKRDIQELYALSKSGKLIRNALFQCLFSSESVSKVEVISTISAVFSEYQCDETQKENQRLRAECQLLSGHLTEKMSVLWQARARLDDCCIMPESSKSCSFFDSRHVPSPEDLDQQAILTNDTTSSENELLRVLLLENQRGIKKIAWLQHKIQMSDVELQNTEAFILQAAEVRRLESSAPLSHQPPGQPARIISSGRSSSQSPVTTCQPHVPRATMLGRGQRILSYIWTAITTVDDDDYDVSDAFGNHHT